MKKINILCIYQMINIALLSIINDEKHFKLNEESIIYRFTIKQRLIDAYRLFEVSSLQYRKER